MSTEDADLEPIEILNLPLDGWHRARAARMVEFAGYHMPIQYEGILAEHEWTRANAGLFDVSHMGQISLTGDGLDTAIEAVIPADLSTLAVGRQRYSMLLDQDGGILDDLMVSRRGPDDGDDIFMVVNGAMKFDDLAWLLDQLPDDITLNLNEDQALLALQGPKAAAALAQIVPGIDVLYFMQCAGFEWNGHRLWISRSGYTGEDGFEISVPGEAAAELADVLCTLDSVKPIGLGARDSLRLEAGLPLYGHDLDPSIGPIGAGLGFAINKRRRVAGGFIGHARVAREVAEGAPERLVGLSVEGRLPAREGAPVFSGGKRVGTVTSGGFAPSVAAPIAMARIEAAHAAIGTPLEIEVRAKRLAASVTPMPFVPRRYYRQPS